MEQQQSHYPTVAQCIASCRIGAPLRIELRLFGFRNRRGELRVFLYVAFLPAAFFGAPPPLKGVVRRKALYPARAAEEIFAAEGKLRRFGGAD